MKNLLLTTTALFLLWSLPAYSNTTFEPRICVVQKGTTRDGVYILFYDNHTRRIVSKREFDRTQVGDCK